MTMQTFAPTSTRAAGIGAQLRRLAAQAVRFWQFRKATRKLEGLDDRALNDLGISRSDISRVVHHGRPAPRYYL